MDICSQINLFKDFSSKYEITSLYDSIEALSRKSIDDKLYLAVVGEFSSGKSTFINAMLGKRILKESFMPTTSCAAYIMKGKEEIQISAHFEDKSIKGNERDMSELRDYIETRFDKKVTKIQDVIDILTSYQPVASKVKSLELSVPGVNLPENIVIIDTPGFNPGGDSVSNHFEITKDVVANYADAALVLMPSDQPFSNSIKEFLLKYSFQYLHRCIYILTMGDHKSVDDRKELIDYVTHRLHIDFGLKSPRVFCESAITKLPVSQIPDSLALEWPMWQTAFDKFEKDLWSRLVRQREILLSEHIQSIILNLSKEMKKSLLKRQRAFEKKKIQIDNNKVQHIQEVVLAAVMNSKSIVADIFTEARERCRAEIELEKNNSIAFAEKNFVALNTTTFNAKNKPLIVNNAMELAGLAIGRINKYLSSIKPSIVEQVEIMKKDFNSHYSMFPALNLSERGISVKISKIDLPPVDFKNTDCIVRQVNDESTKKFGNRAMAGVAAGAVAGSIVPGIGTLFGALTGFVAGIAFGGKSSDNVEHNAFTSAKLNLKKDIETYFDEVSDIIISQCSEICLNIENAFDKYSARHIARYGKAVDKLIKEQELESLKMQDNIQEIKRHIRELEELKAETECNIMCLNQQV